MRLALYYHPLSSHCHKVLTALYESGNTFEPQIVNLGDPQEKAQLQVRWPIGKFPVLHDGERDRNVAESSIIIEYLDRFYRGDQAMIPTEASEALQVRHWDRFLDLYVHTPMQDIVADRIGGSKGDMASKRAMLDTAYGMINSHMKDRDLGRQRCFQHGRVRGRPTRGYCRRQGPDCSTFRSPRKCRSALSSSHDSLGVAGNSPRSEKYLRASCISCPKCDLAL